MAAYSVNMVLWKESAFPLWRDIERRWKRNVVCRVSSVIVAIRLHYCYYCYFFLNIPGIIVLSVSCQAV